MSFVLNRPCKSAEEYCKFLSCKQEKCSVRIRSMLKLYMKVRMHHALKMSNMNNSENKSGKHNRKMLKLEPFLNIKFSSKVKITLKSQNI